MTSAIVESVTIHPFEKSGFGHAPYRFVGYRRSVYCAGPGAPVQPGTTCDYCGTSIMDVYEVASADNVRFKVGSDCILRTMAAFSSDVPSDFRDAFQKVARAKREASRAAAHDRLMIRVNVASGLLEANPTLFSDRPHPSEYHNGLGRTLRDYFEWVLRHASDTGRLAACRAIEQAAALVASSPLTEGSGHD